MWNMLNILVLGLFCFVSLAMHANTKLSCYRQKYNFFRQDVFVGYQQQTEAMKQTS